MAKPARTTTNKSGVTPVKLALIGALAIVLVAVLYLQYGDMIHKPTASEKQPPVTAATRSTPRKPNAAKNPAEGEAGATVVRKSTGSPLTWQSPDLASVVSYDPFALPAAFPHPEQVESASALAESDAAKAQDASVQQAALEAERSQLEAALAALKQQGVQVIVKREDKYVAIIGDKEVHVGDEFQGFTVVAIDASGVRLAKDLSP